MTIVYAKFCGENQMHCGLYESRWSIGHARATALRNLSTDDGDAMDDA